MYINTASPISAKLRRSIAAVLIFSPRNESCNRQAFLGNADQNRTCHVIHRRQRSRAVAPNNSEKTFVTKPTSR